MGEADGDARYPIVAEDEILGFVRGPEASAEAIAAMLTWVAAKEAERKADEDETARDGDTRSTAGHRFRREGSVWIDVNYKSSMPSTGVRRGTEAFRALVADVPVVGRVAADIGGEVVVVVGGHAYRIR